MFPYIIDTKYLATYAEGDLNASPTLQEIAEGLSTQPLPKIVTHADHSKYQDAEAFHEAGYDSLLTATIMLRLAAKLGEERKEQVSPLQPARLPDEHSTKPALSTPDFLRDGQEKVNHPVPLPPAAELIQVKSQSKKKKSKQAKKQSTPTNSASARRFQTKNIFDSLRSLASNPETSTSTSTDSSADEAPAQPPQDSQASTWPAEKGDEAAGSWANEVFVQDTTGWVPIEQVQRKPMELIPSFDSAFWKEFGNKLRVFGTQEAVLRIADW